MRIASETRQFARNVLSGGQYWPLVGSRCVMRLVTGIVSAVAFFACAVLTVGFCAYFFGTQVDWYNPEVFKGLMANAMDRHGPTAFMLGFFVVGMVIANVLILPILYATGFFSWGIIKQDLAALRCEVRFEQTFSGWGQGWRMAWIMVVRQTYAILWALPFIVPGIVKSFSYAMTDFIAVEHPDWSANRCIAESCRLMEGNRWRYFCLCLSFIGWALLVILAELCKVPFADCFLKPYLETAQVVFYDELKKMRPPADFSE